MRLTQMKCSFHFAAAALFAAAFVATSIPAVGFTIDSPAPVEVVRGRVPIVVPKSSLPSDVAASGFLAIKIDGQFCAAVGATEPDASDKKPVSPSIVFLWDTKKPMGEIARGDARVFTDGTHEITIEAHSMQAGARDTIVGSAKVSVQLKNRIDQSNPPAPIDLRYTFQLGQLTTYLFKAEGEVFDKYNFSMSGGMAPIMGQFAVMQAIEDPRRDGTALVRYKIDKGDKDTVPFCQLPGQQINMLAQTQKFHSIYRIIDSNAKVIEASVFTMKNAGDVSDCLIALPGSGARVGSSWPSTFHLKLEGISEPADLAGQSTFDSLEWEDGIECAKILSDQSGTVLFPFIQSSPIAVQCKGVAYFAYKQHKLIKNTLTVEFSTNMDSNTIQALQSPVKAGSSSSGPMSAPAAPYQPSGMYMPPSAYTAPSQPAASSPSTPSANGTPVRVRFTIVEELVRK